MHLNKALFADVSLLMVAFVWGATFVLVQNAISFLEPFSFNGIRFFAASLLLGVWLLLFERDQFRFLTRKLLLSGMLLGFWLFIGYAFQTAGLLYTSSSKAGFITGLSVVLVPLFAIFLLKQRPGANAVIGVLIAAAGLYLLTMTDTAGLNLGDGLIFICAIGFAMHIIFTGKFSGSYPTLLLTVVQISTVAVLSSLFSIGFENWRQAFEPKIILSGNVLTALIITSVFATALAFFAQTNFQKFTTPTRVALIFAMEPVFAATTAYMWAGDRLSINAILGCILIFAGMVFAELPATKNIILKKFKRKHAA